MRTGRFNDAQGRTVFEMPRPFMQDSNARLSHGPAYSDAVQVTLAKVTDRKVRLELTPDLAWLRDPNRVYPVVLDPTLKLISLTPSGGNGANASIYSNQPTSNDYGNQFIQVKRASDGTRSEGLLKFLTMDRMPADSAIINATVRLHAPLISSGMQVNVQRNTTVWDASGVTWNTAPGTTPFVWDSATLNSTGPVSFDVTGLMRAWVSGQYARQGIRLVVPSTSSGEAYLRSSFSTVTAERPELSVRYMTASRYGVNKLWTYTSHDHGGGNVSRVNTSTGNLALHHDGGAISARGFNVDLTHTYNSEDDYGLDSGYLSTIHHGSGGGAVYGEGWSFSQSVRLYEVDNGNAVVLKDGSGGGNRIYVKDTDANGQRTYLSPIHFGWKLYKDLSTPPADKVFTLKKNSGRSVQYFDAEGKRTSIIDGKGNNLRFAYDTSDRLITVTDVAGRTTDLIYAGVGGRLSQITDMANRVHSYGYDARGNLTTIKHAVGTVDEVTTTFGYNTGDQLNVVTNPRGHTSYVRYETMYNWNDAGSVEGWTVINSAKASVAQSTEQWYSGSGALKVNMTSISTSESAGAEMNYPAPRALNSVPQELAVWVYAPAGAALEGALVLRHNDGESTGGRYVALVAGWNKLRFEAALVDTALEVDQIEVTVRPQAGQPAYTGAVWIDQVFVKGIVSSVTDAKNPANTIASYSYDWDNFETTVSRPDDGGVYRNTKYKYTRDGQASLITDPLGNITTFEYDAFLNLVKVTAAGETPGTSSTTSYQYSYYPNSDQMQAAQNEALDTDRQGTDIATGDRRYTIDARNEYRRTHNQSYVATIYKRDANGNVTTAETNRYAAGTNLEQGFPVASDPQYLGRLRVTAFTYGAGGLVTSMTPPECMNKAATEQPNCRINFSYQSTNTGYLTRIDAPAGEGEVNADGTPRRRLTTITPNADGTMAEAVDPKGQKTTYSYDGLGQLRRVNYGMQDGTADFSHAYTLDDNGNMTVLSDNTGSGSWVYDANNQPTSESRTQNGVTRTVTYGYYSNGMIRTIGGYGGTSTLGYDNAFRLSTQTDPLDGGRTITYGYDARNRRTSVTFPSGAMQQLTYDIAGRVQLLKLLGSGGTSQTGSPTTLQSFDYDYGSPSAGTFWNGYVRSVTETVSGLSDATVNYGYDDLNRLTSATRTGLAPFTQSYAYDDNNNRIRMADDGVTTTAAYDHANQMTSMGSVGYTYDRNGNLTGFGSSTLRYNAANKWTSGTVSGNSLTFGYDGFGRRVSRTDDGLRSDYWYDRMGLTLETDSSGDRTTYLRDPNGNLRTIEHIPGTQQGGTVYNYGVDRLGSVTALTGTSSGSLAGSYRYDPWGNSNGGTGTAYNPFRYTGTYLDTMTGLYQMEARYYQPGSGRFTQLDPCSKSVMAANRYAYVGGNPANETDPTGLGDCEWIASVICGAATFFACLWICGTAAIATLGLAGIPCGVICSVVGASNCYWIVTYACTGELDLMPGD